MVFNLSGCGIVCLLLTYGALFYSDYVLIFHLLVPTFKHGFITITVAIYYNIVIFLLTIAHLRAVFMDPGIIPLPSRTYSLRDLQTIKRSYPGGWTICSKCSSLRPPRTHHCSVCNRCIRKMDHHCPWVNNCVGEENQRFFMLFLVYVGVCCLSSILILAVCWITDKQKQTSVQNQIRIIHSVVLVMISCLFGLFVIAILTDQLTAIFNDETAVEHVARVNPRRYPHVLASKMRMKTRVSLTKEDDNEVTDASIHAAGSADDDDDVGDVENGHPRKLTRCELLKSVCGNGPVFWWPFPCLHGIPRGKKQFQWSMDQADQFPPSSSSACLLTAMDGVNTPLLLNSIEDDGNLYTNSNLEAEDSQNGTEFLPLKKSKKSASLHRPNSSEVGRNT